MSNRDPIQDTGADPDVESQHASPSTPLWVKLFGIVAIVLALLLVVLIIAGGHGPGRHSTRGPYDQTPPQVVAKHAYE